MTLQCLTLSLCQESMLFFLKPEVQIHVYSRQELLTNTMVYLGLIMHT